MTDPLDADTRQIAFEQFARNFARALLTTPVGWLVVLGMAWGLAPTLSLWTWFGAALACWLLCITQSEWSRRQGFDVVRHLRSARVSAFVDGIGWGMRKSNDPSRGAAASNSAAITAVSSFGVRSVAS